jgi:anaerobic selenocysteine-containing dehydrogenase
MLLIGRRHLKTNNSWLHNSNRMVKGTNNGLSRCTAQLHSQDAKRYNIENGQMISVSSRVGAISLPAEVTDKIMPGVISIPHGWGHNKSGSKWSVAEQHAGVNVNELTDELVVDELSGNAVLNGVPVRIRAL